MNARSRRTWLPVALACVLAAGLFTPTVVLEQSSGTGQRAQLAALVSTAESSRAYAATAVNYAAVNGLDVGVARAQLSQGDSLLATAQNDLQAGTGLSAGIEAVQAAMSDYQGAAAASTVALGDAGLTSSVDYNAALAAVAETNTTVSIVAFVAAQACTGASGAQAASQTCAQAMAHAASAKADLDQAASLLAKTNGRAATSADISQALSLVVQSRAEVGASQSELLTIAAYTYLQRGQSYVSAVVNPLYAGANSTIRDEAAVVANLSAYQGSWTAYVQAQTSSAAGVNSSASALASAVAAVETGVVSTSVSAAQSTAGKVGADMSALLNLAGVLAVPSLVSAIQASASATNSYAGALTAASSWNSEYSGTQLSGFAGYLSTGNADSTAVQGSGAAYISAYQAVVSDLGGYLALPGVSSIYYDLEALPVSSTASGASASLQQEVSEMGIVGSDASTFGAAVSAGESAIIVGNSLLTSAAEITALRPAYLNATAEAALGEVSAEAQAAAQAALSYVSAAQTCLQASVGTYTSSLAALAAAGFSLTAQTQSSTSAAASALSYLQSDYGIRTAEAASGRADVSQAFVLFSSQDVEAGVASMAQACAAFQAASSASA